MAIDQTGNTVELQQRAAQPVLSIRRTVRIDQIGEQHGILLSTLTRYLQQRDITPAGPPFVRYHTFEQDETDVELGFPVAEPVAGEGEIASGTLPGGPAIATWHLGAHDRLGEAYGRLQAGVQAHGRQPAGAAWEVYCWIDPSQTPNPATWPAPADWRTELIQPLQEA